MKKICLISFVVVLLYACKSEPDMERTIFVPDEEDATLPAYTEWGYNSFGAEYEREYFLASQRIVPCKIMYDVNNNQLRFSLHGTRSAAEMTLEFIFPVEQMTDYKDLAKLHDVKIDLAVVDCTVKIWQGENETVLDVLNGELHFKRTQLLYVDDQVNRVILSGTFDLRFMQRGFPTNISYGRFDLGMNNRYFTINNF